MLKTKYVFQNIHPQSTRFGATKHTITGPDQKGANCDCGIPHQVLNAKNSQSSKSPAITSTGEQRKEKGVRNPSEEMALQIYWPCLAKTVSKTVQNVTCKYRYTYVYTLYIEYIVLKFISKYFARNTNNEIHTIRFYIYSN